MPVLSSTPRCIPNTLTASNITFHLFGTANEQMKKGCHEFVTVIIIIIIIFTVLYFRCRHSHMLMCFSLVSRKIIQNYPDYVNKYIFVLHSTQYCLRKEYVNINIHLTIREESFEVLAVTKESHNRYCNKTFGLGHINSTNCKSFENYTVICNSYYL